MPVPVPGADPGADPGAAPQRLVAFPTAAPRCRARAGMHRGRQTGGLGARCRICQRRKRRGRGEEEQVQESWAGEGAEEEGGARAGCGWVARPRRTRLCSLEGFFWSQPRCRFPRREGAERLLRHTDSCQ